MDFDMIGHNRFWKFVQMYSEQNVITWYCDNLCKRVPEQYRGVICFDVTPNMNRNRPYDWDGKNCFLETNNEELMLHEICHHLVASLKPVDRRLKVKRTLVPEFGLGAAPSTPDKNMANIFRTMSVDQSKREEKEVSFWLQL